MYEFTEYIANAGYPFVLFHDGKDEAGALTGNSHLIPVQAVGNRMELLGLESIEQTLEYIGREVHDPAMSDGLHGPIQEAYAAVTQEEFQVLKARSAPLPTGVRQTFMARASIQPSKRERLEEVRTRTLSKLGMRSRIHSEPMLRALDVTRPVERTRPAAAEALGTSEECLEAAVRQLQDHADEVERWRVETVVSAVPAMRKKLMEQGL